MADIIRISPEVLREKADVLRKSAERIREIYDGAQKIIHGSASRMKGATIQSTDESITGMQERFHIISEDILEYSKFLNTAADRYEELEQRHSSDVEEKGRIF